MHRRDKKRVKGIDKSFRKLYLPQSTLKNYKLKKIKIQKYSKRERYGFFNHNKTFLN